MDFKTVIKQRYSCRKFSEREVSAEILDQLLAVQRLAPTAANRQPQRIYVLRGEDAREKIAQATPYAFNAKLYLIVCYEQEDCWIRSYDGFSAGELDAAIVGSHLDLAATSLGLGTCWVAAFDPQKLADVLRLPDHHIPVAIFPIGYPAADAKPARPHYLRKDIVETVVFLDGQLLGES